VVASYLDSAFQTPFQARRQTLPACLPCPSVRRVGRSLLCPIYSSLLCLTHFALRIATWRRAMKRAPFISTVGRAHAAVASRQTRLPHGQGPWDHGRHKIAAED